MLLLIFFYRRHLNRKRLGMLALTGLIGLLAVLIPLREYIFVRVTNAPVHTEAGSFDMRLWLIERSLTVIKQHALLGVGIGSYTIASARGLTSESLGVPQDFLIEPVHNVLLLAQGELGIPGTFILLGLYITILSGSIRARGGKAVILSSVLIGMFSLELFDHFLWTLAPGRMLFGLILGLWQGQVLNNMELNDS
jgi:O-antigen ligase